MAFYTQRESDDDVGVVAVSEDAQSLRLEVFDAEKNEPATDVFFENKRACYARFGSQAAANHGRCETDGLRLVIASDHEGRQLGGIALYLRSAKRPLPVEAILGSDPRAAHELAEWRHPESRMGELSGFWVDAHWRKTGLTRAILLCALADSHRLGLNRTIGFSHNHVIDFYGTVGFVPMPSLPTFDYPHPPYVSMLVWADAETFSTVPLKAKPELDAYVTALRHSDHVSWN